MKHSSQAALLFGSGAVRTVLVPKRTINDSKKYENNDIVSEILSSEESSKCEFIIHDNVFQSFAVIDRRIVWYGNINFLSLNYLEENAIRLISESVAGRLTDIHTLSRPYQMA